MKIFYIKMTQYYSRQVNSHDIYSKIVIVKYHYIHKTEKNSINFYDALRKTRSKRQVNETVKTIDKTIIQRILFSECNLIH